MTSKTDEDESGFTHVSDTAIRFAIRDPIDHIHEHNINLNSNEIFLFGEESYTYGTAGEDVGEPGVEYLQANRFIKNLLILQRKITTPILVHMKTCGGLWEEGMAIYDSIRACPNKVIILSYTHARSMSSLILQAADKRVMMPNSTFMFHDGTYAMHGTVKQAITEHKELLRTQKEMKKIYIDSMLENGKYKKKSRKWLEKWLVDQMNQKEEVYFDAVEAVEHGFADEVFGSSGVYDWSELVK